MNPIELASQLPLEQFQSLNLAQIAIQTAAICITAFLLPGLTIRSFFAPVFAVLILGYVNTQIWDAALFLQVPNTLTMHALSLILCNGLLFWLVIKILPGFDISGILPAILGPILFSLTSLAISTYFQKYTLTETLQTVNEYVAPIKEKVVEQVEEVKEEYKAASSEES